MHALATLAVDAPDWVVAEMPPGYQTRVAEIRRLSDELQDMSRFARLLWAIGPDLHEAIRDLFTILKFETEFVEGFEDAVAVKLDGQRRLLLHVSAVEEAIDKKSAEIEQVFRLLHQVAGDEDRVILVTNSDRMMEPADRVDALLPEAQRLLQRMGVNHVSAPNLFRLWSLSGRNLEQARRVAGRLHEQDGGTFTLPS